MVFMELSQVQLLVVVPTMVKAVAPYLLINSHVLALSHESLTAHALPPVYLIITMMWECSASLVIVLSYKTIFIALFLPLISCTVCSLKPRP